jgi:hypothetical protein
MRRFTAATIWPPDKSAILTQFVRHCRRSCKNPVFRAPAIIPVQPHLLLQRTQRDHPHPKDAIGIGAVQKAGRGDDLGRRQALRGGCP